MSGPSRATKARLDVLEEAAMRALECASALGLDHAEVSASEGESLEVNVRQGATDLVKESRSRGIGMRIVHDGRVATSATTDLGVEAVQAFVASLADMVRFSEEDPLALPPSPREQTGTWDDLDLYDPKTARIGPKRAISMATRAEKAAFKQDRRITSSEGAGFSRTIGFSVLATSGGFVGRNFGSNQYLVAHVVADDEGGKKRNGHYWSGGRHFDRIGSPEAVGREAAARACRAIGSQKMTTGVYPVVFDKEAAGTILGLLGTCIMGDRIYREQSYLAARLKDAVASPLVTVIDDPRIPRGPGTRPYDAEGRRTRKNKIVTKGVLDGFLLDTYSARKLDMKPTGSAAGGGGVPHPTSSNFYMKAGRQKPASLLKGIDKGLYVTNMMGFGFDAMTGNFSRGAGGFLIEAGELTTPVGEITISRNLDEILKGIVAIANDLEFKTSVAAPSFRVDQMTISGN
jgi:PmbA protein